MQALTLALWQTPHPADSAQALLRLDKAARQARAAGADWLITPEMFLTGYLIDPGTLAAESQNDGGPLVTAVAALATKHGVGIVTGWPEVNPGHAPFNAAIAIGPDGQHLHTCRKAHLFGDGDRLRFTPGDRAPTVFEWQGWRLGLLICYDVEFPEAVRSLALQGADAVLVPTANMLPFDEVQQVLLPARALENRVFLAYANACGNEGDTAYNGLSTVCGPDGQVLAQAGRDDALLTVTLDPALRSGGSQWPYRRPELYGRLLAP